MPAALVKKPSTGPSVTTVAPINAKIAVGKLATAKGDDHAFYQGKIAASRFYAKQVLPGIAHTRKMIEQGDLELMELGDDIW